MQHKRAATNIALHEIIANRWSPRAFDVPRLIPQSNILSLLEAFVF